MCAFGRHHESIGFPPQFDAKANIADQAVFPSCVHGRHYWLIAVFPVYTEADIISLALHLFQIPQQALLIVRCSSGPVFCLWLLLLVAIMCSSPLHMTDVTS